MLSVDQLRARIDALHARRQQLLAELSLPRTGLPGSLGQSRRRCGSPGCHCQEGEGHPSCTLTFMVEGRKRVEHVLSNYDFNQGGRWLFWQSRGPVPKPEIEYMKTHISNSHLLPAEGNWNVEKAIRWIDRGDHVRLKGHLVTIKHANGKDFIRSSTRRDDKGDGACEVMWVEEVQIGETMYR